MTTLIQSIRLMIAELFLRLVPRDRGSEEPQQPKRESAESRPVVEAVWWQLVRSTTARLMGSGRLSVGDEARLTQEALELAESEAVIEEAEQNQWNENTSPRVLEEFESRIARKWWLWRLSRVRLLWLSQKPGINKVVTHYDSSNTFGKGVEGWRAEFL